MYENFYATDEEFIHLNEEFMRGVIRANRQSVSFTPASDEMHNNHLNSSALKSEMDSYYAIYMDFVSSSKGYNFRNQYVIPRTYMANEAKNSSHYKKLQAFYNRAVALGQ
jgi:hypothetical protein